MGIMAILVMRPGPFEQIFNLPMLGCCILNLIEIGPAVSEQKFFEKVDINVYTISFSRGFGSGELKMFLHVLSNKKQKPSALQLAKSYSQLIYYHHSYHCQYA